ncbi:hypothetical protein RUND412_002921 [Rhizina undulata]
MELIKDDHAAAKVAANLHGCLGRYILHVRAEAGSSGYREKLQKLRAEVQKSTEEFVGCFDQQGFQKNTHRGRNGEGPPMDQAAPMPDEAVQHSNGMISCGVNVIPATKNDGCLNINVRPTNSGAFSYTAGGNTQDGALPMITFALNISLDGLVIQNRPTSREQEAPAAVIVNTADAEKISEVSMQTTAPVPVVADNKRDNLDATVPEGMVSRSQKPGLEHGKAVTKPGSPRVSSGQKPVKEPPVEQYSENSPLKADTLDRHPKAMDNSLKTFGTPFGTAREEENFKMWNEKYMSKMNVPVASNGSSGSSYIGPQELAARRASKVPVEAHKQESNAGSLLSMTAVEIKSIQRKIVLPPRPGTPTQPHAINPPSWLGPRKNNIVLRKLLFLTGIPENCGIQHLIREVSGGKIERLLMFAATEQQARKFRCALLSFVEQASAEDFLKQAADGFTIPDFPGSHIDIQWSKRDYSIAENVLKLATDPHTNATRVLQLQSVPGSIKMDQLLSDMKGEKATAGAVEFALGGEHQRNKHGEIRWEAIVSFCVLGDAITAKTILESHPDYFGTVISYAADPCNVPYKGLAQPGRGHIVIPFEIEKKEGAPRGECTDIMNPRPLNPPHGLDEELKLEHLRLKRIQKERTRKWQREAAAIAGSNSRSNGVDKGKGKDSSIGGDPEDANTSGVEEATPRRKRSGWKPTRNEGWNFQQIFCEAQDYDSDFFMSDEEKRGRRRRKQSD